MTIVIVALIVPEKSAEAAFPGSNGKIAFASDRDGDYEIYTSSSNGQTLDGSPTTRWPRASSRP
jgi:hypothetical protein